ncbi:N-acetyltransferase [Emticicia aquatilis]|uniref:N-acetyltransferase n=1 Tax=Emticicia aquatilis TaxID=1537369 RepID=A0A917DLV6_9BACT|nr:GNAT family N-acetyltransferase [Emticicia aquatilis]GGD48839.1 N-acetyltransferase [Emticicia aquatilis]
MIVIKEIEASETWPLRHKVMWPSKPLDFVVLPNDDVGIHYGLFEKDILVSVISLFVDGKNGQFRKFATDDYFQGRGYGTKLLTHLIEEAKKLKITHLKCSARMTAIEFYERFGMKVASDIIRKNGKDYVIMELAFE